LYEKVKTMIEAGLPLKRIARMVGVDPSLVRIVRDDENAEKQLRRFWASVYAIISLTLQRLLLAPLFQHIITLARYAVDPCRQ